VPRLWQDFVDDAGLFPPEQLPMDAAVARHRQDAIEANGVLTHRFLCPASRLPELQGLLRPGEPWRLGLILDEPLAELPRHLGVVRDDARLRLEAVELRLPEDDDPAAALDRVVDALGGPPDQVDVYVEIPVQTPGWEAAVPLLVPRRLRAKVRCGGVKPELFPSPEALADFILEVTRHRVPFKATAGLHHAVRYRDSETGFDHFGFLNLLVGVSRALHGGAEPEVAAALAEDDGAALATEARSESDELEVRGLFVGYGSCSTSDPVTDLSALGLIDGGLIDGGSIDRGSIDGGSIGGDE
jgi:hypothetical protein